MQMEKRANTSPGAAPSPGRLIANRLLVALLVAIVALSSAAPPMFTSAQTNPDEELGPSNADVNCPNFLTREHAQAVYQETIDNDGRDIYRLDGDQNDLACDSDSADVGTGERASCLNFRLQTHAQALYDIAGNDDPYNLDSNGNGTACEIANFSDGGGDEDLPDEDLADDLTDDEPLDEPLDPDEIPSDLPPSFSVDPDPVTADPPDAEGCDVTVQAGRAYVNTDCDDGTVDAGFLPFEGFDDFAVRAENGFGAFDDTSSFTAPSVQAQQSAAPAPRDVEQSAELTTVEAQQTAPVPGNNSDGTERSTNTNTRANDREQPARPAKTKSKKSGDRQRAKARLAKKRLQAKRARQKRLKQRRAKQRQARLEAARSARQRDRDDRQEREGSGAYRERESTPRR